MFQRGPSGHTSGVGVTRDATKLCLASLNGWVIFPLTERMIADDELLDSIAQFVRERQEAE